jgi:hypothetical protein
VPPTGAHRAAGCIGVGGEGHATDEIIARAVAATALAAVTVGLAGPPVADPTLVDRYASGDLGLGEPQGLVMRT